MYFLIKQGARHDCIGYGLVLVLHGNASGTPGKSHVT